ncbi:16914_t:CDS:2 [Dentiscutata heterogama]|uniref:16914_t:CDS:1 n=1 Tax=Dentiscutata heterogama TaxID=1316150 RepID=A0ACA9M294_9GLOM|nr:16914_t:CDS:2 [Dentiscutata heterogama]
MYVINGVRETPINGTPIDFVNIYCDAWNNDPILRPDIAEIRHKLNHIQLDPIHYYQTEFELKLSMVLEIWY